VTKKIVEEMSDNELILLIKEVQNFIKYLSGLGSDSDE
jgi:hypothetical protein